MDEERKKLLVAGVCLGDITLVLAAAGESLPSYVTDLDVDRLLASCGDADKVRAGVEEEMAGKTGDGELPPRIVRTTLDRAIASGKFLSAIRCLEMLGEKDAYIERCLQDARRKAGKGNLPEAARALVTAANLDSADGIPAFQYAGPELHDACMSDPANCVTRMEGENAVLRAFKYLLPSERVHKIVVDLPAGERDHLLPYVVLESDPEIGEFLTSFAKAHHDLVEAREQGLAELASVVKRVEGEVRRFADSLAKTSGHSDEEKQALDRLRLTTVGLSRELVDLESLVHDQQFHRLARRLEQLLESREQIQETAELLGAKGGPSRGTFDSLLALVGEIAEEGILEEVKAIEERLLSAQVTMLGRSVHSHEYRQYLRELAFKYPASPLMCCLSKINDRWMVVPVWESPVAEILRAHPVGGEAPRQS